MINCSQYLRRKIVAGIILVFIFFDIRAQPNILLITTDDLGLHLGCYGDPTANTQNIDAFANQSILFSNAYASTASCSPSRASMLTGLHPHEHGQVGLTDFYFQIESKNNLIKFLNQQGYFTGLIGKLHIEPMELFPFDFKRGSYLDTRKTSSVTSSLHDFVNQKGNNPFFLMLNFFDPHRSFVDQVEGVPSNMLTYENVNGFNFQGGIESTDLLQEIAGYYNGVARLDVLFQNVINILKENGLYDNTIILFTSDHGAPFNRGKFTNYESGVKVPFILKIPGYEASVINSPVSLVDIVPTLADIVSVDLDYYTTGNSILPMIEKTNPLDRNEVFTTFNNHATASFTRRAVRIGDYKLIHNVEHEKQNPYIQANTHSLKIARLPPYQHTTIDTVFDRFKNPPAYELYDLSNDPNEFYDIYENIENQNLVEQLKKRLLEWQISTSDFAISHSETKQLIPSVADIDFGYVTQKKVNATFNIVNQGSFYTLFKGVSSPKHYRFSYNSESDTIYSGESLEIEIEYTPNEVGIFNDTITFLSNSDVESYLIIKSIVDNESVFSIISINDNEIIFHVPDDFSEEFDLEIYDLAGRVIISKQNLQKQKNNLTKIETINALKGTFVIQIADKSLRKRIKVCRIID